jgi:hypothetical protein
MAGSENVCLKIYYLRVHIPDALSTRLAGVKIAHAAAAGSGDR